MFAFGSNWRLLVVVAAAAAGLAGCNRQPAAPQQASEQQPQQPGQQVISGFQTTPAPEAPVAEPVTPPAGSPPAARKAAPPAAPKAQPQPAPRAQESSQSRAQNPAPASASAPAPAAPLAESRPTAPEPPKVRKYTVPAGTAVVVRTTNTLTTKQQKDGDSFVASLEEPIVVDGVTIAAKGTTVHGRVVTSDPGGRVKGRAMITLALTKLDIPAGAVSIDTTDVSQEAKSSVKKDAVKIGAGAAIGAAIGAIAGGGKGAAIGSAAGGGAGAAATMATRGDPAEIPAETVLRFTLQDAFTVTRR